MSLTPEEEAGLRTLLAITNKTVSDLELAPTLAGDMLMEVESGSGTFSSSINNLKTFIAPPASLSVNGIQTLKSNRNAIINGDFNIWQRGTSFTSVASGTYTADRWVYSKDGTMVHDITRSTDTPTVAQAGRLFLSSLKVDCQTAQASIGATNFASIKQIIEGYNFLPLAQKAMTLSFWVKATKTGIYNASLRNLGNDRSYVFDIAINASNTWEQKIITIPASPSAGTWDYANSAGLSLTIHLACGTTYQSTSNSWLTGNFGATTNQVNACDSTSNDFFITGVQLEAGSVATPFEYRTIQQELSLCQRYFEILPVGIIGAFNSNTSYAYWAYKVQKRTIPTFVASASSQFSSVYTNCETHVIVQIGNNITYINGGSTATAEL